LAQARHRFVSRVCLVNTQARLIWVGAQTDLKQARIRRVEVLAKLVYLRLVSLPICGILKLGLQSRGCSHSGTTPVKRTPPGKSKPRFIPKKNQIGFDGQALFHDPLDVIDLTVECAVGKHEHSRTIEFAGSFE